MRLWLTAGLLVSSTALAVSTKSFVVETSDAFEKGTVEGASVDSSGKVTRSVQTARTPIDGVSVAYASALGPDGAIYVATGSEGAIGSALPEPKNASPRRRTTLRSASSVTVTRPCLISGSRNLASRGALAITAGGAICTLGTRSPDSAA